MRDHGGNLDAARARFGGAAEDWIDLSTGINPRPYLVPELPGSVWDRLPEASALSALSRAASDLYGGAPCLPVAGAQAAIQLLPRVLPAGEVRILAPTYNEHAASFCSAGHDVREVESVQALAGAPVAVLVNPNNPDGQAHAPADLLDLAGQVGHLIVDESFADPEPELSLAPHLADLPNTVVLRSFGKFFGLAGVRLGFALTTGPLETLLTDAAGPWAVSGPAAAIGATALLDATWIAETRRRLARDAARLDGMAERAGWRLVGGTPLFRTYETHDADAAQDHLARHHIWSRIFPYSKSWIRLGLTDGEASWARLEHALETT
ncbi:threonine-phosphate decarboxylase CobD [Palleronia caenipelagi]|uniref:threonine-phosphate decarboxylase n=1 Tax=Palleronia caenipelagi TaxID=2489174 RepID=A0A547Q8I5_9RHOB|nr:threonine-phosphate decarboxylase CobD [Palleronia caenipelagi]TRD22683.1 threonine-phosphate decarboxylase [Palleronia caenipelagi]